VSSAGPEREQIIACLQAALTALELDDEAGFRSKIGQIAEYRSSPVIVALARLTRELGETLGSLHASDPMFAELPDACARLEHVVRMTEEATHKTLDLVERSRFLVEQLPPNSCPDAIGELRLNLSNVALAQAYQDLTGQIIKRVVSVVRRVYETVAAFGIDFDPNSRDGLAGPVVSGIDNHGVSQVDADDLLKQLDI
jgi:chemotaxis protein CheZ